MQKKLDLLDLPALLSHCVAFITDKLLVTITL